MAVLCVPQRQACFSGAGPEQTSRRAGGRRPYRKSATKWEGKRESGNVEDRPNGGGGVGLRGVWANHAQRARSILQQGDVEEAMNAAAKIGDDALQAGRSGAVVPERFTHSSSAQRVRWLNTGLQSGSVKACDTFSVRNF